MPNRDWIVTFRSLSFSGAVAFVSASSEEEARRKAHAGDWSDGPDCGGASIADWDVASVKPNE